MLPNRNSDLITEFSSCSLCWVSGKQMLGSCRSASGVGERTQNDRTTFLRSVFRISVSQAYRACVWEKEESGLDVKGLNLWSWVEMFKASGWHGITLSPCHVPFPSLSSRFCLMNQKVLRLNLWSMDLNGESDWIEASFDWISVTYFPWGFPPRLLFWPHTSHTMPLTTPPNQSAAIGFTDPRADLAVVYFGPTWGEWGNCANINTLTHFLWFIQAEECCVLRAGACLFCSLMWRSDWGPSFLPVVYFPAVWSLTVA